MLHNKLPRLGAKQHYLTAITYQYTYEHRTLLGTHKLNKKFSCRDQQILNEAFGHC